MKVASVADLGPRSKFLLGGVLNTATTYVIYLALRIVVEYQWAFFVAYACGIVFSYFFNAYFVFRATPNLASAASFPLVYLFQYAASAGMLLLTVEWLGIDERVAPLLVTVTMIPATYICMRLIFRLTAKKH